MYDELSRNSLDNHKQTFKQRIKAQGLSVIDLQQLQRENMDKAMAGGLSGEARYRLGVEGEALIELQHDIANDVAPTQQQEVQQLRADGKYETAEYMEHSAKLIEAEKRVKDLEDRLANAPEGQSWQRTQDEQALEKARDGLKSLPSEFPHEARERKRTGLMREAAALRKMATHDGQSLDPFVTAESRKLIEQADEMEAKAEQYQSGDAGAKAAYLESHGGAA